MKRVTILSLALASVALPVVAQSHPARNDEEKVSSSLFVQGDTLGMHEALRQNMPQAYNVPGLPRFAIFGKEGKFYLGIGGQVKVTAGYDLGDVIDDPNCFTTSALPMNGAPGNGGKFQISAQQSSLFVNMVALPGTANQIGAYVSVNFMGESYAPSIVQAYLKYRGITAGYAFSLFSDMAAAPPTIDYEGPNAFTALPHTVLYYEKPFGRKKEWKAGVGVEQPANSFTLATKTLSVNQRVPDIPAYIQYSWNNGKGWLRFSAMLRNLYYRDLITAHNVDRIGWGVKASGSTPIVGNLTAYYQAVYGKGISSYIQDLNGMGMDLMPSATDLGKLNPIKAWGAYGGLQYNFSKSVFCSATYSHVRTYVPRYAGTDSPWGEQYRYAQYVVANVFWNINSLIQTGVEYLYGRRVNYNGDQSHDNRIQAMLSLNF